MIPGQPQLDDQGRCAINASGQPQCSPDGSCCCDSGPPTPCPSCPIGPTPLACQTIVAHINLELAVNGLPTAFASFSATMVQAGLPRWLYVASPPLLFPQQNGNVVQVNKVSMDCGVFSVLGLDLRARWICEVDAVLISGGGSTPRTPVFEIPIPNPCETVTCPCGLMNGPYNGGPFQNPGWPTNLALPAITTQGVPIYDGTLTLSHSECAAPDPTGACCLPDGSCVITTQASCNSQSGTWQGDDTSCVGIKCPPPTGPLGACCYPDGSPCADLTQLECQASGGNWQGQGTSCAFTHCPPPTGGNTGACCVPQAGGFGLCENNYTRQQCDDAQGLYLGDGTTCGFIDCPPPPYLAARRPAPGVAEMFNWAKAFATAGRVSDAVRREREAICATCDYVRRDDRGLWCSVCGCGTSDDSRRIFNLASYNEGPLTSISLPQWGCKHPQRAAGKGWRR